MDLTLILTTIFTSAADSLNPVAITQQFVLQGMVKKRSHIWYFIWATYITNFIGGMMVYYGLLEILSIFWSKISKVLGSGLYISELVIGVFLIGFSIYKFMRVSAMRKRESSNNDVSEAAVKSKIKSVRPIALFSLGVIATIMELSSAFPYFAFLGVLLNYQLSFLEVVILQAIYNLIYALPLMVLYFIYCRKQELFDRVYLWVKQKMQRISIFVTPVLFFAAGVLLVFHAINSIVHL